MDARILFRALPAAYLTSFTYNLQFFAGDVRTCTTREWICYLATDGNTPVVAVLELQASERVIVLPKDSLTTVLQEVTDGRHSLGADE